MVDKIYTFNFNLDDELFDTTIIVAPSFEEAINTFKEKRIDDYIVQWTYSYGVFTDIEDDYEDYEDDYEEDNTDDYDEFKKMWDLTTAKFDEGTTKDLLNYRIYKMKGYTAINIIEFPMSDYNLIGVYGFHNTFYDRIDLIEYANKEMEEIIRKSQPDVKRANEIKSKLEHEDFIISRLIDERCKVKLEMFKLDSDSEKYKSVKKRFMELRKEIETHMTAYDELLLSYKED